MSKKYEREDWAGNKYWEDESGNREYEKEDWAGNKYREGSDGNRTYEREDWAGNKYREDSDGNREYEREDWAGNKYRVDSDGNRTYKREDWVGNTYEEKGGGSGGMTSTHKERGRNREGTSLGSSYSPSGYSSSGIMDWLPGLLVFVVLIVGGFAVKGAYDEAGGGVDGILNAVIVLLAIMLILAVFRYLWWVFIPFLIYQCATNPPDFSTRSSNPPPTVSQQHQRTMPEQALRTTQQSNFQAAPSIPLLLGSWYDGGPNCADIAPQSEKRLVLKVWYCEVGIENAPEVVLRQYDQKFISGDRNVILSVINKDAIKIEIKSALKDKLGNTIGSGPIWKPYFDRL